MLSRALTPLCRGLSTASTRTGGLRSSMCALPRASLPRPAPRFVHSTPCARSAESSLPKEAPAPVPASAPAPVPAPAAGKPAPQFHPDTPRSAMLYRLAVGGVAAYVAFVCYAAYDGHLSANAKQKAEDAVLAIPLYKGNPVVFLDFEVNGSRVGRVVFQLRKDKAPVATENFRQLCTGEKGFGFKATRIHAIIPGQYITGGDYQYGTGEGGAAVKGTPFPDEDTGIRHIGPGVLSMNSVNPNENGSLFMVTMAKAPIHDHRYMAFGNVLSGLEVLKAVERLGDWSGGVKDDVRISNCGELVLTREQEEEAVQAAKAALESAKAGVASAPDSSSTSSSVAPTAAGKQ